MPEYKVIALSVGGRHRVFSSGDIVTDVDFEEGHAKKLADPKNPRGQFLELIKGDKPEEDKPEEDKPEEDKPEVKANKPKAPKKSSAKK